MGHAKKSRPRKAAGRSRLVKWMVAGVIVGGIGYGISQMSNVAYGEAQIKVVDLSGLDAKQKRGVLETANAERCTCGCGMTLAQCIATDSTCPIRQDNVDKLKTMVNDAARKKS
jgi:hypothetical protein